MKTFACEGSSAITLKPITILRSGGPELSLGANIPRESRGLRYRIAAVEA
jgi:hypothetical protein